MALNPVSQTPTLEFCNDCSSSIVSMHCWSKEISIDLPILACRRCNLLRTWVWCVIYWFTWVGCFWVRPDFLFVVRSCQRHPFHSPKTCTLNWKYETRVYLKRSSSVAFILLFDGVFGLLNVCVAWLLLLLSHLLIIFSGPGTSSTKNSSSSQSFRYFVDP